MRDIIRQVLQEESGDGKLLSYFIKKWDKEKDSDGKVTFNPDEIKKLGLMKHFNKIRLGFIDYYEKNIGNPVDDILKELTETTFTTDDIKKLGIDVGGYDFKFDIEDILLYTGIKVNGSFGMIKPYARIKEGTVTHDGETFDLTDINNAEEHKYWNDVEYEVEDLISFFIEKKLLSYGFNLDDLELVVYMYKNKSSLNENVDDKKIDIANNFFNTLNLIPYHDKEFKMEYLGTKKGLFLIMTSKRTIYIQKNIYDIFLRILGKEKYVKSFVWDKLKNLGFSIPPSEFMYLEPDREVGSLDDGDKPGLLKEPKKLNESVNDKIDIANKFIDSLKLVPYHNKRYKMEYLGTKAGRFLFFTQANSLYVERAIYDMLLNIFGHKPDVEYFIYKKLESLGFTLVKYNKNYIEVDTDIGEKEEDDKPGLVNEPEKLTEAKMLPKNKFAKAWLSKYNDLKKYKSENGRFIYLANDNGSIIVSLDTQMNETAVSYELIWSMLERHFTEKETRRKIIGWLLDRYHLADMGYVYDESQDMMGKIDSSDTLIESRQITESQQKNQLKDYFFKKWTKQKEQGQIPKLSSKEITNLGLGKYRNEIIVYYSEFMNLDPENKNTRTELIKNYLLNGTFDEKTITDVSRYLDQGKIEVEFGHVDFYENINGEIELTVKYNVLSGSFYNEDEGETYRFSSLVNPFDDFVSYSEFRDTINEIIQNFIGETLENFGFDLNRHIDYIEVEEY